MKPTEKENWRHEDIELAREFRDVSEVFDRVTSAPPPVPRNADRMVRRVAHPDALDSLQRNWLFGYGPQVALAAMIFFAIGILTVVGLRQGTHDPGPGGGYVPPVTTSAPEAASASGSSEIDFGSIMEARQKASSTRPTSTGTAGHNWVRVTFSVDADGRADVIRIVESCVRPSANAQCVDDDVYDELAIGQIRQERFEPGTEVEEIVFIP